MRSNETATPSDRSLRQSAEKEARANGRPDHLSKMDMHALCHELEVHQIELEMQNEELLRAQVELAASEEKYWDLYEFAPIGYLTLEDSGKILEANLTAASILGTEKKYLINNLFQAYLATGGGLEFMDFCRRVMDSDVKQTAEFRLRGARSDGKANLWILAEGRAIQNGINQGFRMAVTDISKRKQAEEELLKSKDELNLRVAERTEDLQKANRDLTIAKDAAEEAAMVKAAFMANMSHELRTPMNSVIGFTSLLLEEKLTPEQKDYVESIRNGGESLMALINDVLDFSRMDREKTERELQTFDLRTIVEESQDLVAAKAAEKSIELIYTFGRTAPEAIIGDPGKLLQVLGNLLSNAVKFTKDGEVEVEVSSDSEHNEVHVAVRDTGIGIPQEDMAKLFQPFSQGDMSLKRGYESTGLGLAISRKLVDLMGGKIWDESEVGKGSTFHFIIPAKTSPSEQKPFLEGNFKGFKGKRVLII